jgi:predicted ATPase
MPCQHEIPRTPLWRKLSPLAKVHPRIHMISEIQIENFKSISKLSLKPGNVTVLIGENGSGKSNILEAITFAAAASANKLDDEFLYNRGIRVTEKDWMTSGLKSQVEDCKNQQKYKGSPIVIKVVDSNADIDLDLHINRLKLPDPMSQDEWLVEPQVTDSLKRKSETSYSYMQAMISTLDKNPAFAMLSKGERERISLMEYAKYVAPAISEELFLSDFLIFAPENSVLRRFEEEGAIKPLGPKGEGLLKLLEVMSIISNGEFAAKLKSRLNLLGWFGDLQLPTEVDEMKGRLRIRDRWLSDDAPFFDQRSANEGFLYLLFYFTLMLSPRTPRFFAIDNIDNALNPKLCAELMRQITVLAAEKGKQVICTTHNPAILDGLNLHDDRQRLYVVRRDSEGHTIANRVQAPRPRPDGASVPLSTAFMSGLLGGLPDHF